MIACQVEVDGRWCTGCYVTYNAEAVQKHWFEKMRVTRIKSFTILERPTDPYWKAELFRDGQWLPFLGHSQGELRAMLYLYDRWAVLRKIHPADWRIKGWHPMSFSGLDPLVPTLHGPKTD